MKRRRFPLLLEALVLGLLGVATGVAGIASGDAGDSPGILLVNRPLLYDAPDGSGRGAATDWPAGMRLQTLDRSADEATTAGLIRWRRVRADRAEGWLPEVFLGLPPMAMEPGVDLPIACEMPSRCLPLPPEYRPGDLMPVGPPNEKNRQYLLRKEAAENLRRMFQAAKSDGIELYVVSAWRSWSYQQELYERTLRHKGWTQSTVAPPGLSEHQLGTAVDLGDGNPTHLLVEGFGETPAGKWLRENAWKYGFAQSFTRHNQAQTGIAPEPWHYRYWGIDRARSRHPKALGLQP